MTYNWITFDLDETIMQNPFKKWVFPEIVEIIQSGTDEQHDIMEMIVEEHLKRMSENKFLEAYNWDDIIRDLLMKLKIQQEINITELVEKHSISPKVYMLEDKMLDNLQFIKNKGFKLAVATNGYYKYQFPVLQELGLDLLFDEIIASDTAGYAKPSPSMLKSLQGKVIAHVGDRIDHDVYMANELGVTSIFINKDLPEEVLQLPVDQRYSHPKFYALCEEKWYKENRLRKDPFNKELCLPNLVVSSIEELAAQVNHLLNN